MREWLFGAPPFTQAIFVAIYSCPFHTLLQLFFTRPYLVNCPLYRTYTEIEKNFPTYAL